MAKKRQSDDDPVVIKPRRGTREGDTRLTEDTDEWRREARYWLRKQMAVALPQLRDGSRTHVLSVFAEIVGRFVAERSDVMLYGSVREGTGVINALAYGLSAMALVRSLSVEEAIDLAFADPGLRKMQEL